MRHCTVSGTLFASVPHHRRHDREHPSHSVALPLWPVFNVAGQVEAALNVTGTTQQVNSQTLPTIIELVKESARRVSTQLGYRPTKVAVNRR